MTENEKMAKEMSPADQNQTTKGKSKMPKKCPSCKSTDILEGDGGDWYYCNNCMCQMDKDGNVIRPGYWG